MSDRKQEVFGRGRHIICGKWLRVTPWTAGVYANNVHQIFGFPCLHQGSKKHSPVPQSLDTIAYCRSTPRIILTETLIDLQTSRWIRLTVFDRAIPGCRISDCSGQLPVFSHCCFRFSVLRSLPPASGFFPLRQPSQPHPPSSPVRRIHWTH